MKFKKKKKFVQPLLFIIFRVVIEHRHCRRCIEFVNSRVVITRISSNRLNLLAPYRSCLSPSPPRPPDFSFSFFRNERRFPRPKAEFHDALLSVSHSTRRDLSCLNEMQSISRFFLPFLFVRAVFGMRSIRIGRAFKRGEGGGEGGTRQEKIVFVRIRPLFVTSLKLYLCALLKSFASPIHPAGERGWVMRGLTRLISLYRLLKITDERYIRSKQWFWLFIKLCGLSSIIMRRERTSARNKTHEGKENVHLTRYTDDDFYVILNGTRNWILNFNLFINRVNDLILNVYFIP